MKHTNDTELIFSTGQFAKLCGVKKDTLLHYDHIGLLKPCIVYDNGYRCYSADQLLHFNAISRLRASGLSLSEIKDYLDDYNPQSLLSLFEQLLVVLQDKKQQIEHLMDQVNNTITATSSALSATMHCPRFETLEGSKLAVIQTGESCKSYHSRTTAMSELYKLCMNNRMMTDFLRGGIVLKEHIESGSFERDYLCVKLEPSTGASDLFIQPPGLYTVVNCKGGYSNICEAYALLIDHIRKCGCRITGNAYEFELLGRFASDNPKDYVMEIAIQVEPK